MTVLSYDFEVPRVLSWCEDTMVLTAEMQLLATRQNLEQVLVYMRVNVFVIVPEKEMGRHYTSRRFLHRISL